jgi:hypothetical protein
MESRSGKVYQRTTVYLTAEQRLWLRRVAAQAQLDDVPMSASDVVRLAIARLRNQLPEDKLREALIAHIQGELEEYPGRARRGLPQEIRPQHPDPEN